MNLEEKILLLEEQMLKVMAGLVKLIRRERGLEIEIQVMKATLVDMAILLKLDEKTFMRMISNNVDLVERQMKDEEEETPIEDIVDGIIEAVRENSKCKH
jgi:hypothetical protein